MGTEPQPPPGAQDETITSASPRPAGTGAAAETTRIGSYTILHKLGQGGMGAVYKAYDPSLDRDVALKLLPPYLADNADFVTRFHREAAAAAKFSHSNLVHVYAAGEDSGTHYIAMELVEGRSLRQHIERHQRLDCAEALSIAVYAAEALRYAWNKAKLIHRDIKPENILLSRGNEVKVADLGLAKSLDTAATSVTSTGQVMGSPHYISPEQAEGVKDLDYRTDIYSLGATLFHMLTGRPPYEGDKAVTLLYKHVHDPVPDPTTVVPDCPPRVAALVKQMLAKNPAQRPADYDTLIAELTAAHAELAQPGAQRNKSLLLTVGLVITIAAVAGLLFWSPWKPPGGAAVNAQLKDQELMKSVIGLNPNALALSLALASTAVTNSPAAEIKPATKDAPWVNSLGMKFVPVAGTDVLFSIWDTRVQDYEVFAKATGQKWPSPSFAQGPTHPAVNVSWDDAKAYCDWLTKREQSAGRLTAQEFYRLPTDLEWSAAVGLTNEPGSTPKERDLKIKEVFPWGRHYPPPKGAGNYIPSLGVDNFEATSPVGSFLANRFGLYDMGGNVWQWCEDLIEPSLPKRVLRGACWFSGDLDRLLASCRYYRLPNDRMNIYGFRCVLAGGAIGGDGAKPLPPPKSPAARQALAAEARYNQALSVATRQYLLDLDTAQRSVMQSGNIDEANAIRDTIKQIKDGKTAPTQFKTTFANGVKTRYEQAVAAATQQYSRDLDAAAKAALAAGNLDEANAITAVCRQLERK